MDGSLSAHADAATNATIGSGSHKDVRTGCGTSRHEWLYLAAYTLLGKDPGEQLADITGYPSSSCGAYVAHNPATRRRQPDHFTRTLIHSDKGEQFHTAFMEGCVAIWWQQFRDDAELGRQVRALLK